MTLAYFTCHSLNGDDVRMWSWVARPACDYVLLSGIGGWDRTWYDGDSMVCMYGIAAVSSALVDWFEREKAGFRSCPENKLKGKMPSRMYAVLRHQPQLPGGKLPKWSWQILRSGARGRKGIIYPGWRVFGWVMVDG